MKRVATSNEFFDILDKIGGGKFVTIGYVTSANLDVPTISKKNPKTNRLKNYPDYSVFEQNKEVGALVKITSYNMRYEHRGTVGKKYGEYKNSVNAIRGEFGLEPMADRNGYKEGTNWSPNGPEIYAGNKKELSTHSYNPQNIFGARIKSRIYAVDTEGNIIAELRPDQVKPYLKAKREESGVAALRKMGSEEEKIREFIQRIQDLKFKYVNFESSSILWIAASIDGEKIVYINDRLQRTVDEININPQDFIAIAKERYKEDIEKLNQMEINENKNKKMKTVRLNEIQLKQVIAESVKKVLTERFMSDKDIANQYGDMKITYFEMEPLKRSDGWSGTFELEFPNADGVDYDETMVNNFIVYDIHGDRIAWDNWMPDKQTEQLEKIIRREIRKRAK